MAMTPARAALLRSRLSAMDEPERRHLLRAIDGLQDQPKRIGLLQAGLSKRLRHRIDGDDLAVVLRVVAHALRALLGVDAPAAAPRRVIPATLATPRRAVVPRPPVPDRPDVIDTSYWSVHWSFAPRGRGDARPQKDLLIRAASHDEALRVARDTLALKPRGAVLRGVAPFEAAP